MNLPIPTDRLWMIAPGHLDSMLTLSVNAAKLPTASGQRQDRQQPKGVAVIEIVGVMQKYHTLFSWLFGGASSLEIAATVRSAAADPNIGCIVLYIDSPGGSVAGTQDLAEAIFEARQVKPVIAYISDIGASAAYWVASQASEIYANATATVGSIGTYAAIADYSKLFESAGIKVHVIKAGEHKAAGVVGTEITEDQLAEWQRVVNSINSQFIQGVARGRKLPPDRVRGLADGRVHVGAEAQRLGLIDGITSFSNVLGQVAAKFLPAQASPKVETVPPQQFEYKRGYGRDFRQPTP